MSHQSPLQVGGDEAGHGASSDQGISIDGMPGVSIFKTSPLQVSLLSADNFGAGKIPSLLRVADFLLSPVSNADRIKTLIEFGWLNSTDIEMANAMVDFSSYDWKEFVSQLRKVKIVPGQLLSLEIDLPARNQHQPSLQGVDSVRNFTRDIPHIDTRFNAIISGSQDHDVRFERHSNANQPVRNQSLMPSGKGHLSILCWAVAVKDQVRTPVVLKLRNTENKEAETATEHECKVLRFLQKVDGIPKLHGNGTYQSNNSSFLVMHKEHTYPRNLETLSARGVFQVIYGLTSIANNMHALGLLHNNLHPYNLMYEPFCGNLVVAGFQYASIDLEGPESARQRCRNFGINDHSPLKVKPINIKSMDNAARSTKHDSFNLGAIILSLLGRDLQMFSKRRQTDLSSLENLSGQQIAILVLKGTDTFNSFLDQRSEKLEHGDISVLIQLVRGLLHADPALRIDCAAALAILDARPNRLQPQLPKELIVPAKLVDCIQEMQRPTKIKACFDCVDPAGNVIQGMSLWSFGGACAGDLLAPYMGLVHSKPEGDVMSGNGHGTNLKSIKIDGMDMVLDARWNNNGCADLFFFATNGPAGLANCNASVQVKRDGKGGKRIRVTRFPANAYFEKVTLSRPFMLPVPGRHWSNEIILLRAARDLKDNEQIFVDYGTGTMMNMFGVCSGEIVIPKPVAKKGASAKRKKQPRKKQLACVAAHSKRLRVNV